MGDASISNERMRTKCNNDITKIYRLNRLEQSQKDLLCKGPYWKNTGLFGRKVQYVNANYRNYKTEKNEERDWDGPDNEKQELSKLDDAINSRDNSPLANRFKDRFKIGGSRRRRRTRRTRRTGGLRRRSRHN